MKIRASAKLLSHYNINKQTLSYHQFNEHKQLAHFIQLIRQSSSVALISDAGTPGISDPDFINTRMRKENIEIECPRCNSFCPALINSALPSDSFYFYGFLPHKKGRQSAINYLSTLKETFILYESPFRLLKTLEQLAEYCGSERKVCVSRELTKIYEENVRTSLAEAIEYFSKKTIKGEIVIVVEGCNKK